MSVRTASATNRWDRAGVVVSGACAVHCVLLPLVTAALPVLGLGRLLDARFEWVLVATTAVLGGVGHWRAFRHNHHHVAPGVIFLVGFSLVVSGRLFIGPRWLEAIGLGLGGSLAAASHYANLRWCRCCHECAE
jgi:MerC mercury resistance protein